MAIAILEIEGWAQFKSLIINEKHLLPQYVEYSDRYEIYAGDGEFLWHFTILKDNGVDHTDFENNFKSSFNQKKNNVEEVDVSIEELQDSTGFQLASIVDGLSNTRDDLKTSTLETVAGLSDLGSKEEQIRITMNLDFAQLQKTVSSGASSNVDGLSNVRGDLKTTTQQIVDGLTATVNGLTNLSKLQFDGNNNLKIATAVNATQDRSVYVSGTGAASTELNTDTVIPNGESWFVSAMFFGINKASATGSYAKLVWDPAGTPLEFGRIDSNDGATRSIQLQKTLTGNGTKVLRLIRYNTSVASAIVTAGVAIIKQ